MNSSGNQKPISIPFEITITLLYLTFGVLWILFSDKILLSFTENDIEKLAFLQTAKGWVFIMATAFLLLLLLRSYSVKTRKHILRLEKANAEAEKANRLKASFLANLSHDLRTPVNALNGFSELIRQYVPNPEICSKYDKIISENSAKLLRIIDNIVDISNIQVDLLELNPVNFTIDEFCNSLRENTENIIPGNKLIHFVKPHEETPVLQTDLNRLLQICEILVLNTISKAGKGTLKISCFVIEDKIAVDFNWSQSVAEAESQRKNEQTDVLHGESIGWDIATGLATLLQGQISTHTLSDDSFRFLLTIPMKIKLHE